MSHQTVSRVINNFSAVREKTRRKVEKAIEKLNYHPSLSAQSLKSQRTRMIGVIASNTQYSGPLLTIAAIESMAREHGLFVTVATVDEARLNPAEFTDIEESFIQLGVEAVVIAAPTEAMVTLAVESKVNVPRVIITAPEGLQKLSQRTFDSSRVKFVCTNHKIVSESIVNALHGSGVTNVYYLSGPQQWRDAYTRRVACERACELSGLPLHVLDMNDWVSANAYDTVSAMIRGGKIEFSADKAQRTAFWGTNDLLVLGSAQRALVESGYRVPDDVCIIGYDDMPGTESIIPPLTTVNPCYEEVESTAMQLVLDMLNYSSNAETVGTEIENAKVKSAETVTIAGTMATVEPRIIFRDSLRLY